MKGTNLNFLHTCDYASFGDSLKLNAMGIFENINPLKVPYVHPQMFVVTSINTELLGKHTKVIKLANKKGDKEIARVEIPFDIKKTDKKVSTVGTVGQFNSIKFDSYGDYKVQIFIDETLIAEREIKLLKPNTKNNVK